jgi:pyruvate formate lyase activating enzyme
MYKEAMLYEPLNDHAVHCFLCNHHCRIADGELGFCGVRKNVEGRLNTLAYGKVVAAKRDPIEKKPLYHFMPGSPAFSIATVGCNFHCGFCQNWQISQIGKTNIPELPGESLSPRQIVEEAQKSDCKSIAYTYTEPTIFFEYAYDSARLATEAGLSNVFVTNGFMTTQALETISPYLNACNVDLKSFSNEFYKEVCHGRLKPVLNAIRKMKELGIWVEVTTLIIPEQNDSDEELQSIARFIAGISPDIPWHISRFHPDYRHRDAFPTSTETLRRAYATGKEAGLHFVYTGNLPGVENDTVCPGCQNAVIRRDGLLVSKNRMEGSRCPDCGAVIPGVFL